ncbi:hypothetical protein B0H14DRAFT_2592368 [Mycena olivaceomarginata]|nr:hypothetical protein B0H14DRAFT_2592368 [Mycena olivaceomarginata]
MDDIAATFRDLVSLMRDYRKTGPTAACFEALDAVHARLEAAHEFPRDAESPESFSAILTKSMAAPIQIMTAKLQAHHKALQSLTKSVESVKAPRPEAHAAAAAATAAPCQFAPCPAQPSPHHLRDANEGWWAVPCSGVERGRQSPRRGVAALGSGGVPWGPRHLTVDSLTYPDPRHPARSRSRPRPPGYGVHGGIGPVCNFITGAEIFETLYPPAELIDELIEGAGGSDGDLAKLVADHIRLVSADPENWLPTLHSVDIFVGTFRGDAAWIAAFNESDYTQPDDLADMCFNTATWMTEGDLQYFSAILKAGLLNAIVACARECLHVPTARRLLDRRLPAVTVYRSVLRHMRSVRSESVPENIATCGIILAKTAFRRCAGCLRQYYCSESCQRADWRAASMPARDRDFLRALVNRDYLAFKDKILASQAEFISADRDEPFYIAFDYSSGYMELGVQPFAVELPGGIPVEADVGTE